MFSLKSSLHLLTILSIFIAFSGVSAYYRRGRYHQRSYPNHRQYNIGSYPPQSYRGNPWQQGGYYSQFGHQSSWAGHKNNYYGPQTPRFYGKPKTIKKRSTPYPTCAKSGKLAVESKPYHPKVSQVVSGYIPPKCVERDYYDDNSKHACDRRCRKNDRRICYYRLVFELSETHNPIACGKDCKRFGNCHKCLLSDGVRIPVSVTNNRLPAKPIVGCFGDIFIADMINLMFNSTRKIQEKDFEHNLHNNLRFFDVKDSEKHAHVLTHSFFQRKNLHRYLWMPKYYNQSHDYNTNNQQQLTSTQATTITTPQPNSDDEHNEGEPTTVHWHGIVQHKSLCADGVPYVTQAPIKPGMIYRGRFEVDHAGTSFQHSHMGLLRGNGLAGALIIRDANDPHILEYDHDLTEHAVLITDVDYTRAGGSVILHVNGLGISNNNNNDTNTWKGQPHMLYVKPNRRYRIRCIYNGIGNNPIDVSIDEHFLSIIAVDGNPVKPAKVSSFVMNNAERFDFVLDTHDMPVKNYLMHVVAARNTSLHQVAIINYKGAAKQMSYDDIKKPWTKLNGLQLNTPDVKPKTAGTLCISELESVEPAPECLRSKKCKQTFVEISVSARGFQMNNYTMEFPERPLLTQLVEDGKFNETDFCNSEKWKSRDCGKEICNCTHLVRLEKNACNEIVLFGRHPFHLHGYHPYLVSQGIDPENTTMNEQRFKELDRQGLIDRNLYNPPAKDTINTARLGYSIFRFCADNPGLWLGHCHIELHTITGMAMVFMVGDEQDIIKRHCRKHIMKSYKNNKCAYKECNLKKQPFEYR